MSPLELLGWIATATFVASYFCRRPIALRRVQMIGAFLWVMYGIFKHVPPVVVANVMVFSMAAWTSRESRRA
jgi:hypothetical protein